MVTSTQVVRWTGYRGQDATARYSTLMLCFQRRTSFTSSWLPPYTDRLDDYFEIPISCIKRKDYVIYIWSLQKHIWTPYEVEVPLVMLISRMVYPSLSLMDRTLIKSACTSFSVCFFLRITKAGFPLADTRCSLKSLCWETRNTQMTQISHYSTVCITLCKT